MNKISDITRQDILDIIRDGFVEVLDEPVYDSEIGEYTTEYRIHMPYFGRLDEIGFFQRVYDLESLPSYDNRYSDALTDISCHLRWNDYENFWFFQDRRFKLLPIDGDEPLLKFICEMLHPAVRKENGPWKEYLEKFNEILEPDGYKLIPTRNVSGRQIYEAHEIDHVVIPRPVETIYAGMRAIGEGSYARVFRYTDPFYQRDFVLKRAKPNLDEKELQRFKREFEEMQSLRSPYIVEVYSYNDEKHEYIMELMDFSLEKYISDHNQSMTLQERRSIIMQLLRAYGYLHTKIIYHRDISPKNVLLKQYDDVLIVKLSDFGLVKIVDSDLTSENTEFKGSLNDPALKTEGFANYGLLHEVYAITLLFAYILTGKSNWAKIDDPTIKAFMTKGTNPDKTKRFQTLDELGEAVKVCFTALERQK